MARLLGKAFLMFVSRARVALRREYDWEDGSMLPLKTDDLSSDPWNPHQSRTQSLKYLYSHCVLPGTVKLTDNGRAGSLV